MTLRETLDRALLSPWGGRVINLLLAAAVLTGGYLLLGPGGGSGRPAEEAQRPPERIPVPHPQLGAVEQTAREHLEVVRNVWTEVLKTPKVEAVKQARADAELGRVYLAYNFPEAAAACFTNAEAFDPVDYRWPFLLAEAQFGASQVQPAAESMERALNRMQGDLSLPREQYIAALSFLGNAWSKVGNEKRAAAAYNEILKLNLKSLLARFELGRLALDRGDYPAAQKSLEQAHELAPRNATVRQALATAYRAQGNAEKAAELTEGLGAGSSAGIGWANPLMAEVRALNRGSYNLVKRALRERNAGKTQQAIRLLESAVQTDPRNVNAWINLGVSYLDVNRLENALKSYEKAEELGSTAPELHIGFGLVLLQQETDLEQAKERFERVLSDNPDTPKAIVSLAAVEMRLGQTAPALDRLQTLLAKQSTNVQASLAAARCLFTLQRFAEARETLEAAHTLTPTAAPLAEALARFLATCPDEAQRDAARAVELADGLWKQVRTISISETLAMALAEAGRFDEAIAQQEKTLTQVPAGTPLDVRERIQGNLERYRDQQPCRDPWPASDPFPSRRLGGG